MNAQKQGRNERCWCGSDKKYKHCHLGREIQEPLKKWDTAREFRNAFSTGTCLAPKVWLNAFARGFARNIECISPCESITANRGNSEGAYDINGPIFRSSRFGIHLQHDSPYLPDHCALAFSRDGNDVPVTRARHANDRRSRAVACYGGTRQRFDRPWT